MFVLMMVGFRNTSITIFVGFRNRSRPKKFICPVFSCVGLNFLCVCLVHIRGDNVRMYPFGVIYNQNIIYVTYVECYIFGVEVL
jgi:hypothetical protein